MSTSSFAEFEAAGTPDTSGNSTPAVTAAVLSLSRDSAGNVFASLGPVKTTGTSSNIVVAIDANLQFVNFSLSNSSQAVVLSKYLTRDDIIQYYAALSTDTAKYTGPLRINLGVSTETGAHFLNATEQWVVGEVPKTRSYNADLVFTVSPGVGTLEVLQQPTVNVSTETDASGNVEITKVGLTKFKLRATLPLETGGDVLQKATFYFHTKNSLYTDSVPLSEDDINAGYYDYSSSDVDKKILAIAKQAETYNTLYTENNKIALTLIDGDQQLRAATAVAAADNWTKELDGVVSSAAAIADVVLDASGNLIPDLILTGPDASGNIIYDLTALNALRVSPSGKKVSELVAEIDASVDKLANGNNSLSDVLAGLEGITLDGSGNRTAGVGADGEKGTLRTAKAAFLALKTAKNTGVLTAQLIKTYIDALKVITGGAIKTLFDAGLVIINKIATAVRTSTQGLRQSGLTETKNAVDAVNKLEEIEKITGFDYKAIVAVLDATDDISTSSDTDATSITTTSSRVATAVKRLSQYRTKAATINIISNIHVSFTNVLKSIRDGTSVDLDELVNVSTTYTTTNKTEFVTAITTYLNGFNAASSPTDGSDLGAKASTAADADDVVHTGLVFDAVDPSVNIAVQCVFSHNLPSLASAPVVLKTNNRPDAAVLNTVVSGQDGKITLSGVVPSHEGFEQLSVVIREKGVVRAKGNDGWLMSNIVNVAKTNNLVKINEDKLSFKVEVNHFRAFLNSTPTGGTLTNIDAAKRYELAVILHTATLLHETGTGKVNQGVLVRGEFLPINQSHLSNVLAAVPNGLLKEDAALVFLRNRLVAVSSTIESEFFNDDGSRKGDLKLAVRMEVKLNATKSLPPSTTNFYSVLKNGELFKDAFVADGKSDIEALSETMVADANSNLVPFSTLPDSPKVFIIKAGDWSPQDEFTVVVEQGTLMNSAQRADLVTPAENAFFTKGASIYMARTALPFSVDMKAPLVKELLPVATIVQLADVLLDSGDIKIVSKIELPKKENYYELYSIEYQLSNDELFTDANNIAETTVFASTYSPYQVLSNVALELVEGVEIYVRVRLNFVDHLPQAVSAEVSGNYSETMMIQVKNPIQIRSANSVILNNGKPGTLELQIEGSPTMLNDAKSHHFEFKYFLIQLYDEQHKVVQQINDTDFTHTFDVTAYINQRVSASVQAVFTNTLDAVTSEAFGNVVPSNTLLVFPTLKIEKKQFLELHNETHPKQLQVKANVNFGRMNAELIKCIAIVPHIDVFGEDQISINLHYNPTSKLFESQMLSQQLDVDYASGIVYIVASSPNSFAITTYP